MIIPLFSLALTGQDIARDGLPETFPPKRGVVDIRRADAHTLVVHWRDGYVTYHRAGQKRTDDKVILDHPLDVRAASSASAYSITLPGGSIVADRVNRKSKGTNFAWFIDSWVNNRAENKRPDYAAERWLYVHFPRPLRDGSKFVLQAPWGKEAVSLDAASALSDSVHVNLLGYRPDAGAKYGYLYAWEGDGGGLDVRPFVGKPFQVVEAESGRVAWAGSVAFRFPKEHAETGQTGDTPNGNYLGSDVAECDFTGLRKAGQYYLWVPGVGRSHVFKVGVDVFRPAFRQVMMGILGQRSGIALGPPSVPYRRPAPHNPLLTPGFGGKLKYTSSRILDRRNPDSSPEDRPAVEAGIKGELTSAGWYQDAGDWDSYPPHIQVPANLLLAYELAPTNFSAGELKLPDEAGPMPDILKEAVWLPRFCYRLRHELIRRGFGTGGLGLRICGDYFGNDTGPQEVGRASWQDVDRLWTASGEDPLSTLGYAAVAAHTALCLREAKVPSDVDWAKEAEESFAWAEAHTKSGDEKADDFASYRIYALCGLAVLKPGKYDEKLLSATSGFSDGTRLWWSTLDGPATYLLSSGRKNSALVERFQKALLGTADAELTSSQNRALRWGGDWYMPMLVGEQTTPWVAAMAVAAVIAKDPQQSAKYRSAVETTADYFLGDGPLNMTWVSGLGPNFPRDPFHLDGWYEEGTYPRPGIIPYGPWIKGQANGQGPWDHDWANKSVYPAIDLWPGAERWFDNRCCPMTNEFTIWQNMAPAALVYGFLCGPKG